MLGRNKLDDISGSLNIFSADYILASDAFQHFGSLQTVLLLQAEREKKSNKQKTSKQRDISRTLSNQTD